MELTLNIYDKRGKEVVRTATGETYDIMLGTIENLMSVLDIESVDDNMELLKKIYGAYGEVKDILCGVFGDITEEEWKTVKIKEIVPVLMYLVKFTFLQLKGLPSDPKN